MIQTSNVLKTFINKWTKLCISLKVITCLAIDLYAFSQKWPWVWRPEIVCPARKESIAWEVLRHEWRHFSGCFTRQTNSKMLAFRSIKKIERKITLNEKYLQNKCGHFLWATLYIPTSKNWARYYNKTSFNYQRQNFMPRTQTARDPLCQQGISEPKWSKLLGESKFESVIFFAN